MGPAEQLVMLKSRLEILPDGHSFYGVRKKDGDRLKICPKCLMA